MRAISFSKRQIGILLFALLFFSACPPIRDASYVLSNRILLAYQHDNNLDTLRAVIEKDSFLKVETRADGILLHCNFSSYWPVDYSLWINDSLMIVEVEGFSHTHTDEIDKKSGRVLFEQKLRKLKKNLVERMRTTIPQTQYYYDLNVKLEDYEATQAQPREIHFQFNNKKIEPVSYLNFTNQIFGNQDTLHFRNGMLTGAYRILDTRKGLLTKGYSEGNLERGNKEYIDSSGVLQWTEQYKAGELQQIIYTDTSTYTRAEAPPTLKRTVFVHRFVFYCFLALGILLCYGYFKFSKYNISLHKGRKRWELAVLILASPVFALLSLIIFMILASCINAVLVYTLGWDIPLDSIMFLLALCSFAIFETFYYAVTARVFEIPFHGAFLTVVFFLFKEYQYLYALGVGIV